MLPVGADEGDGQSATEVFSTAYWRETLSRLSASTLTADEQELVDASVAPQKLDSKAKAELVESIFGSEAEGTLEQKLAQLLRAAGSPDQLVPELTVECRDLTVEADALVGAASMPTVLNSAKATLQRLTLRGGLKTRRIRVLDGVSGLLRPGSCTLLLAPPGSGKSVLLQALSGRLQPSSRLHISGSVKYNGVPVDDFVVQRTAGLVHQYDFHIPDLTVLETVDFASECTNPDALTREFVAAVQRGAEAVRQEARVAGLASAAEAGVPGVADSEAEYGKGSIGEEEGGQGGKAVLERTVTPALRPEQWDPEFAVLLRRGAEARVKPHIVLRLLGLHEVAHTIVGDAMKRGISGGQRKRVTTGEIIVGPQGVIFMDEISTGLDSATTFSVVQSFRNAAHALRKTLLVSLLQPPAEVFHQFDDVLLLTDGRALYHGPVEGVLEHFRAQGFSCPARKDPGSFLQARALCAHRGPAPLRPACRGPARARARCTRPSSVRAPPASRPWPRSGHLFPLCPLQEVSTPAGQLAYATPELLAARGLTEGDRDPERLLLKPPTALLTPVAELAAAFWERSPAGRGMLEALRERPYDPATGSPSVLTRARFANSWGKVMRLVLAREMPMVFSTKRVYYKVQRLGQRDANFLGAGQYTVALTLCSLPMSLIEALIYTSICYWTVGLTPSAGRYLTYLVIYFSGSLCMSSIYRAVAFALPMLTIANAVGAIVLLLLALTNGFSLVRQSIPAYAIWAYWINPLAWILRALGVNELMAPRWNDTPYGPIGQLTLEQFGIYTARTWVWMALVFLLGSLFIYSVLGALALHITNAPKPRPVLAEEEGRAEVARTVLGHAKLLARKLAPVKAAKQCGAWAVGGGGAAGTAAGGGAGAAAAEAGSEQPMAVPFTPVTLVTRDLRYYVPDPSSGTAPGVVKGSADKEIEGKLELLKGINLFAEPGNLVSLMGGSGAGKTTLMDCILGRKTTGLIRGDILVQRMVDQTLDIVELSSLRDSIVGDPGSDGLSIEQRKRLSIAVELVANPSDEPTSGLDARAAAIVIRAVKNVALSNRTVMVTIHQPSIDIFEQFTTLVLLQRGGRLTYFGPLGFESADLIAYLEAQPGVPPITPGYNPATWMLEVTGGSTSTAFKSSSGDFPAIYAASQLKRDNDARAEALVAEGRAAHEPLRLAGAYATPLATQARWLVDRWFKLFWRTPDYNYVRLAMTVLIALVFGLLYLNIGKIDEPASVSDVQNVAGMIFSMHVQLHGKELQQTGTAMVLPVISAERLVYYRHRASSIYAPAPFALASEVAELPYLLVQSFLMVVIVYWMAGFQAVAWKARDRRRFWYFYLTYTLGLALFTFFGHLLVFATPDLLVAQLLAAAANMMWIQATYTFAVLCCAALRCGTAARIAALVAARLGRFLQPYSMIPAGWKWMNRITPTTWLLEGLAGSQLSDDPTLMVSLDGSVTTVGAFADDVFGWSYSMVWWCALILLAFVATFRVAAVLALTYLNFLKR
eukprot:scaffold3.g6644.t1